MVRTVLVVNPHSANGRTGRQLDALSSRARAVLGELEVKVTTRPGHATVLTSEALDAGAECVVAVGGDGTNNEVVNGFVRPDGTLRSPNARFAFVPQGTGGDLRRTFGLNKDPEAGFQRARLDGVPTDVGMARFVAHSGEETRRAYINIASAGLSGMVDRMVNTTSRVLGPLSFMVGSLRGLAAFRPYPMTITVDSTEFHRGRVALCTAANGQCFGGGMRICPDASTTDGLLSVVCLPAWSATRFVLEGRRLYFGDIRQGEGVRVCSGKEVEMQSSEEVLLDVDGEQPGRLPAKFHVLPRALRVCR
jgi:YegS/Rv2252/BmrU family lipid kinase